MSPIVRIDLSSLVNRQMYFIFLILFLQWLDNAEKKVSGLQPIATSVSGIKVREWKALRCTEAYLNEAWVNSCNFGAQKVIFFSENSVSGVIG